MNTNLKIALIAVIVVAVFENFPSLKTAIKVV